MRRDLVGTPSPVVRARGQLALLALTVLPVALWLGSGSLADRFDGSYRSLTSVAVILAYAGTAAFALNLVLGARLRPIAALFGGLDGMYRAHRWNGQLAFGLLFGHVVLMLAGRATISAGSTLDLLGPGAGWTVFAGVLAFSGLTVAIALTLFGRLGHEVFVYVQRSFGVVFILAAFHALATKGTTHDSGALTVYLAALASVGLAAFAYRSVFGSVLVRRRRYRVESVNRLDELVTEIVMQAQGKPAQGKALEHLPGQFLFVSFPTLRLRPFELSLRRQVLSLKAGEIRNQFHPFSITSAPGEPELRITVKALGDYTRALRALEPGAEAVVEGAFGEFSRAVANPRQIWIAGGIGVTPFLAMARSLAPGDDLDVDFYYCVEHKAEAHFLDELRTLERERDGFRVTLVPRLGDGFLTATRLAAEHDDLTTADVLVCGPPAMIENLRAQLRAEGHPPARFHAEEFSFASVAGASAPDVVTRPTAASDTTAAWSDGQVIALLAALAFAALTFAFGLAVGGTL
jgi:predicted ferric reductase